MINVAAVLRKLTVRFLVSISFAFFYSFIYWTEEKQEGRWKPQITWQTDKEEICGLIWQGKYGLFTLCVRITNIENIPLWNRLSVKPLRQNAASLFSCYIGTRSNIRGEGNNTCAEVDMALCVYIYTPLLLYIILRGNQSLLC